MAVARPDVGNGSLGRVAATADADLLRSPATRGWRKLAVGLGPGGEDLWHYPMSQAIYTTPIEQLATIPLGETVRQWLIAGPDGSINIVSFDGKPTRQLSLRPALTGLAAARSATKRCC